MKKKMILSIVSILFVLNGITLYADQDAKADDSLEQENIKRQTLLKGKTKRNIFAGLVSKSTKIYGDYALLMGGEFGVTFNNTFSVGVAGYGKANMNPGLPGYGGVTLGYAIAPHRLVHLKLGALFGAGSGCGGVFFIFEPELKLELNLTKAVRIGCGISRPFTDKKWNGLNNLSLVFGIWFGR